MMYPSDEDTHVLLSYEGSYKRRATAPRSTAKAAEEAVMVEPAPVLGATGELLGLLGLAGLLGTVTLLPPPAEALGAGTTPVPAGALVAGACG
jgi:hypothetical protein